MAEKIVSETLTWGKFNDEVYAAGDEARLRCKYIDRMAGAPPTPSPDEKFFDKCYWTAIAKEGFAPNTGLHYWEMAINTDNLKVGLATEDAPTDSEMGHNDKTWAVYIQTGECEHNRKERLKGGVENGVHRRMWRLVVSIAGGRFGCLLDTNEGTLRLFFNGEYQGIAFDGLKDKTLHPAVGIMACEDNNRTIGTGGKFCQFVSGMNQPAIPAIDKKVIC